MPLSKEDIQEVKRVRELIAGMIISDCDGCVEADCGNGGDSPCTLDYQKTDQILKEVAIPSPDQSLPDSFNYEVDELGRLGMERRTYNVKLTPRIKDKIKELKFKRLIPIEEYKEGE